MELVFVAGAAGVIGRRLCPMLVADGWQVTGTTRSPARAALLRAIGVEPAVVDVFDAETVHAAVTAARPQIVLHQLTDLPPGLDPAQMAAARPRNAVVRERGTRHLIAAALAAGARRFIAQSVAFAYASGPQPYREDAPLATEAGDAGVTARGVLSLERQVLEAPLQGLVLRLGRLYGPGTGFDRPASVAPVHVDAAADAMRRALTRGAPGVYNVAEDDGTVDSRRALEALGWRSDFRCRD
ncbi:MAG: NAD-dependent epimerase/dehydratase family protein [Steroidobacteraceae bacterium]